MSERIRSALAAAPSYDTQQQPNASQTPALGVSVRPTAERILQGNPEAAAGSVVRPCVRSCAPESPVSPRV